MMSKSYLLLNTVDCIYKAEHIFGFTDIDRPSTLEDKIRVTERAAKIFVAQYTDDDLLTKAAIGAALQHISVYGKTVRASVIAARRMVLAYPDRHGFKPEPKPSEHQIVRELKRLAEEKRLDNMVVTAKILETVLEMVEERKPN